MSSMSHTTQKVKTSLLKFYQQPIAKVSLELVLSIGAVLFFAIFAIRPTLLTMSDLVKEIEDKQELDNQLSQKIAALSTVQTEYLALQTRLGVLDQAIPSQPKLEEALKIIEKLASDHRLVINTMRLTEIPDENPADLPFNQQERISLPLTVSVVGDYLSIKGFLDELQANRRALIVDSVIFSVSEERQTRLLKASITISIQYFGKSQSVVKKAGASQAQDAVTEK